MIHLFFIPSWINTLLLVSSSGLAIWKGDGRARAIATVEILAEYLEAAAIVIWGHAPFPHAQVWYSTMVDGLVLATSLACAVNARRYWVIGASSMALLAFLSDAAGFLPDVSGWAWQSSSLIWSYLLDVCLLWGVWASVRDRGRVRAAR